MRIAVIVNQGAGAVVTGQVSADSLWRSFQQEGTEAERGFEKCLGGMHGSNIRVFP